MYVFYSRTRLFILGVLGIVLNRSNLIIMLMSIELMLLAIFLFLINSVVIDNLIGQIFTRIILTVAAAETSICLAILVAYYRIRTIAVKSLNLLRG